MESDAKKTALRMIPYGLYVLTAQGEDGGVAAATINWVTQASFAPPLVAAGVKVDSGAYALAKASRFFGLNVLGKEHTGMAYTFFKTHERDGMSIAGQSFAVSDNGTPLLEAVPAWLECKLVEVVEHGDHAIFVGEVIDAQVKADIDGRPDDATLWLKDLGEKVFYGG